MFVAKEEQPLFEDEARKQGQIIQGYFGWDAKEDKQSKWKKASSQRKVAWEREINNKVGKKQRKSEKK